MKRKIRLKWFVAFSFLTLALVLVAGYSFLSARFFIRGMDSIIAGNMAQVVESYVEAVPAGKRRQLNLFSGYHIAGRWQQMPDEIRKVLTPPAQTAVMRKNHDAGWFAPPDKVYFVMRVTCGGDSYFITRTVARASVSPLVGRKAAQNMHLLLLLSLVSVLTLAGITWLVIRQVERPVRALGQWAHGLNESSLEAVPPDFSYPELNDLAELIRTSLCSVKESLEREHLFLQHSSHELRTPISVIRNNVELLHKLQQHPGGNRESRQKRIVERIDRASLTMKHLTETLLWLSRESEGELPAETLDLEKLICDLIEESRYLLKDKDVELIVGTDACPVSIPGIAARIVLGNLIRNAFQHTSCGTVWIVQKCRCVEIKNHTAGENAAAPDLGFGLGLRLTEQLTQKLGWPYKRRSETNGHLVEVCLG